MNWNELDCTRLNWIGLDQNKLVLDCTRLYWIVINCNGLDYIKLDCSGYTGLDWTGQDRL